MTLKVCVYRSPCREGLTQSSLNMGKILIAFTRTYLRIDRMQRLMMVVVTCR
jgi:hypothetical protein